MTRESALSPAFRRISAVLAIDLWRASTDPAVSRPSLVRSHVPFAEARRRREFYNLQDKHFHSFRAKHQRQGLRSGRLVYGTISRQQNLHGFLSLGRLFSIRDAGWL